MQKEKNIYEILIRENIENKYIDIKVSVAGNVDSGKSSLIGVLINGKNDKVVNPEDVSELASKLKQQKGITVTHEEIDDANHFFEPGMTEMLSKVENYIKDRIANS